MKRLFLSLAAFSCFSASALAVTILAPGDAIIGGVRNGGNFEVGAVGVAAGVNNWPGAEPPEDLINGVIGGGGEKYLNFARLDTGVIVTPAFGASVVRQIEFWVANDAPERDPSSYELWGTNNAISGGGPFDIASNFSLISSGALDLPLTRDITADASGFSQVVNFANNDSFTTYMLLFPTVRGPGGNSMQISEVQFDTIPEPTAGVLALLGGAFFLRRRR